MFQWYYCQSLLWLLFSNNHLLWLVALFLLFLSILLSSFNYGVSNELHLLPVPVPSKCVQHPFNDQHRRGEQGEREPRYGASAQHKHAWLILVFIWKLYTCINVTDSWTTWSRFWYSFNGEIKSSVDLGRHRRFKCFPSLSRFKLMFWSFLDSRLWVRWPARGSEHLRKTLTTSASWQTHMHTWLTHGADKTVVLGAYTRYWQYTFTVRRDFPFPS